MPRGRRNRFVVQGVRRIARKHLRTALGARRPRGPLPALDSGFNAERGVAPPRPNRRAVQHANICAPAGLGLPPDIAILPTLGVTAIASYWLGFGS